MKKPATLSRVDGWTPCNSPIIPRRTVTGGWTAWSGQTWIRLAEDGKVEYLQTEESLEQYFDRQW